MTHLLPMTTPSEVSKTWRVHEEYGGFSIRDFLIKVGEFSRQLLKKVRISGSVYVNGKMAELWQPLEIEDEVKVVFPKEERGAVIPRQGPLSILFEDEDVLVIDKPPGIPVVPPFNKQEPSIASYLLDEYKRREYPCTVHVVTRLDRETSGLMLVSKHAYSHMLLTKKLDEVSREYVALVQGCFHEKEGLIDEPIARAEDSIIKRTVAENGKPSQTKFYLEKQGQDFSRVRFKLLTGRTHQIRVHMAFKGYPLAGDTLYGARALEGKQGQALHCDRLCFLHPWTKEKMRFVSEPPKDWDTYA
ncbi:23S rRNA pseudouridine1911/1915/1917 synthase [Halobacillus karajensis]|uniref:Pseudouridine synthase n=1 Tax=Halobacillus karajensis TaxID=195088 RepID=A0A024P7K3_9BACI|nr:RluA family pseudouridine synthase [Halobacillus karajensis]CDQ21011.1 Ribosomal large subunit pseudouridine synthase D [Halobacillus karajensis]CDQ24925.1 Ribosomal large subunit pseudouridine synthase D [Halobacillus karajensis]CDQ28714.1 Ribosomal large subunit pseudouridine synthase D [Halobacillus karajensis]SEH97511.1 23S rRNA pseudouridine1911/1915/1917 synthase [Halobacillus karajensis]